MTEALEVKYLGPVPLDRESSWYVCEVGPKDVDGILYTAGGDSALAAAFNAFDPNGRVDWSDPPCDIKYLKNPSQYSGLPYIFASTHLTTEPEDG